MTFCLSTKHCRYCFVEMSLSCKHPPLLFSAAVLASPAQGLPLTLSVERKRPIGHRLLCNPAIHKALIAYELYLPEDLQLIGNFCNRL